jgi:hypothetical protein
MRDGSAAAEQDYNRTASVAIVDDVRVDESAQGRALRLFVRACARWFNSSLTRRSSHLHASSWASHRSAPVMLSIIL